MALPILEIKITREEITSAPIKAQMPTACVPKRLPSPKKIAIVAPNDAPEDIPRIYGSAKGFLTMACMMMPDKVSPIPTHAANNIRGKRNFKIMSAKSGSKPVLCMLKTLFKNTDTIVCQSMKINPNFKLLIIARAQQNNKTGIRKLKERCFILQNKIFCMLHL